MAKHSGCCLIKLNFVQESEGGKCNLRPPGLKCTHEVKTWLRSLIDGEASQPDQSRDFSLEPTNRTFSEHVVPKRWSHYSDCTPRSKDINLSILQLT